MLDENLPVFFLAEATDGVKHHETFLLRRDGAEPEPAYSLRHADPTQQSSKNCYAVALFDAWNPDVLYGEVLIRPKWTQPSLNAEEIRRHGGTAPPPEPIMPTGFTVQLYNPELQIEVVRETGTFGSTHYDFSMPQDTFRMPSGSMLDRTQNAPATNLNTPRINFSMKREGKLSKDMTLYVRGKSTDIVHKKKSKEPDIAIALFKGLKEVTILESNLYRVEMEDVKGLEVVTLLISAVIRDVFYGQMSQAFNVSSVAPRRTSAGKLSPTGGRPAAAAVAGGAGMYTMSGGLNGPGSSRPQATRPGGGPITDPRTQWEIDQETQRLKKIQEDEARLERKNADMRRRERERADAEEARRIQQMLEQEEREQRRKQAEVDKETERLQKIYGNQQLPPPSAGRPPASSAPIQQSPFPPPTQNSNLNTYPQFPQQHQPAPTPYQQYNPMSYNQSHPQNPTLPPRPTSQIYPAHPSSSSSHGQGGLSALNAGASLGSWFSGRDKNKQKSNANLRRTSDPTNRLQKKTSSVF